MSDRYKDFLDELELSYKCATFNVFPDVNVLWFEENSSLFIRGSDSICDWIFNILAIPVPYKDVHLGFYIQAQALIEACLDRDIKPTTVVGHSAGGAIAILVGEFFDCEAYALACPKICTANSTDLLLWSDEKCVIINQENDLVSKVPPWFQHPVEPLVLDTTDFPIFAHHLVSFE